jgi:hypothetical protein
MAAKGRKRLRLKFCQPEYQLVMPAAATATVPAAAATAATAVPSATTTVPTTAPATAKSK